jgi:hypothetical protein
MPTFQTLTKSWALYSLSVAAWPWLVISPWSGFIDEQFGQGAATHLKARRIGGHEPV